MHKKFAKIIIFLAIIATIVASYFFLRSQKTSDNVQTNKAVPTAQNQPKTTKVPEPENNIKENDTQPAIEEPTPEEKSISPPPEKFLLEMPFYSQAPLSKWDAFHEDMCEEASVLNGALYLLGKKLTKEQFETELQKMQSVEKKEIGEWKSTTIAETKKVVDIYFEGRIKTKILENPTIEDIEREITAGLPAGASAEAGNPVVVPLAGREIGNPNFTPPGPIYHMLVIKGYDAQNFITNDVGTRKGNSYVYKKEVIMKNMHDWNEQDIHIGTKQILVLYK